MSLPKERSGKYRKMKRKTARGAKSVFLKRKKAGAACAVCRANLAGVGTGSRTEKSVSRKFGGHLCHACTARIIRDATRVREKTKGVDEVDLIYRSYVQQLVN